MWIVKKRYFFFFEFSRKRKWILWRMRETTLQLNSNSFPYNERREYLLQYTQYSSYFIAYTWIVHINFDDPYRTFHCDLMDRKWWRFCLKIIPRLQHCVIPHPWQLTEHSILLSYHHKDHQPLTFCCSSFSEMKNYWQKLRENEFIFAHHDHHQWRWFIANENEIQHVFPAET